MEGDFSKVARMVDENGLVVVQKDHIPTYVIVAYEQLAADEELDDDELLAISRRRINEHIAAYRDLSMK